MKKRLRDLPKERRQFIGFWCMYLGADGPAGCDIAFLPNGKGYFAEVNYVEMYYCFFDWFVFGDELKLNIHTFLSRDGKEKRSRVKEAKFLICYQEANYLRLPGPSLYFDSPDADFLPLVEYVAQFPFVRCRKRLNACDREPWKRLQKAEWGVAPPPLPIVDEPELSLESLLALTVETSEKGNWQAI